MEKVTTLAEFRFLKPGKRREKFTQSLSFFQPGVKKGPEHACDCVFASQQIFSWKFALYARAEIEHLIATLLNFQHGGRSETKHVIRPSEWISAPIQTIRGNILKNDLVKTSSVVRLVCSNIDVFSRNTSITITLLPLNFTPGFTRSYTVNIYGSIHSKYS